MSRDNKFFSSKKEQRILVILGNYSPRLSSPNNYFFQVAKELEVCIDIACCSYYPKIRSKTNFTPFSDKYFNLIKLKGIYQLSLW